MDGWFIFNYLCDSKSNGNVLAFLESQRRMENIPEESLINWASGKGLQSGKTLQVTIVLCI